MERQELLNYHVVFTRDSETAAVVAELPTLQLAEFGADLPEALERLQAMASFHLDCLAEEGKAIPLEKTRGAGFYLHLTRSSYAA